MDPTENDIDAIPAKSASSRSNVILALIIVGVQTLISLVAYPFLPDRLPSHWNIAGQVDGYMAKPYALFIWPLSSFVLFFLLRFLILVGPRLGQVNQRANLLITERILVGLLLFFLALQLMMIAVGLQIAISSAFVLHLLIGLLFIFLGNYMGKLRRNFWAGIRTPWTLVSDVAWERTHRVGSWLFVLAGALILLLAFMPDPQGIGMVVIVGLLIGVLLVYSYVVYRREEQNGRSSQSPPFD